MKLLELISKTNPLYHFTSFESFLKILKENKITPQHSAASTTLTTNPKLKGAKTISLTRNKNLNYNPIRIDLDKGSLSHRYKIFSVRPHDELDAGPYTRFWQEEVIVDEIKNIKQYIINVQLIVDISKSYFNDTDIKFIKDYFKLNSDPDPETIKKIFIAFCIKNRIPYSII